ncbi:MAG TPA: undecaprenyl-diphosphate phosphatase [Gammaproteobacteria bacterium]|nr:undecaprenyl-diphosphate phosphatase [Gammaproteobacteria bacterium]
MGLLQVIVLALVQGLTEFLPISSSAHLILVPVLTGWPEQGLAFDVAVHLGTLAAVVVYFRRELNQMAVNWVLSFSRLELAAEGKLAWAVIFATIPAGLAGLFLDDIVELYLRSPLVIAWATIGFGLLLWFADRRRDNTRTEAELTWRDVVLVGFAQALALIPGTSRSGITITAGLMAGLSRQAAARFSFLLSIPIILAAGGYESAKLAQSAERVDWRAFGIGTLLSALFAYVCIHYFLRLVERVGMFPFVIYRLVLGAGLLFYFGYYLN